VVQRGPRDDSGGGTVAKVDMGLGRDPLRLAGQ
jgi:hypothetical protein